ncbi:unnamed protein product, partial [Phaeothamnion confervicola]
VRSRAATLLGRLFASQHADYGRQFARNWRDLLGRFIDVDPSIRAQMVEIGALILRRKPELRQELREALLKRLSDQEPEVRHKAVQELADAAADNMSAVGPELLRQVGERMKDKRAPIRKDAATGLAQVYARHVGLRWANGMMTGSRGNGEQDGGDAEGAVTDEEEADLSALTVESPPRAVADAVGWVPDQVLCCYSFPDLEMKTRVMQLLDEVILPRGRPERVRAAGLVYVYGELGPAARRAVATILVDRRRCQAEVRRYLAARDALRATPDDDEKEEALQAAVASLLELCPTHDRKATLLRRLHEQKDQRIFRLLALLCDPCADPAAAHRAREELAKKVGSKTQLGEYLKMLTRRCAVLSLSRQALAHAAAICRAALAEGDEEACEAALSLVEAQSAVFPEQLRGSVAALAAAFEETVRAAAAEADGLGFSDESDDDEDGGSGGGGSGRKRGRGGDRGGGYGGHGGGSHSGDGEEAATVQARLLKVLARAGAAGATGEVPPSLIKRLEDLAAAKPDMPQQARQAVQTLHALAAAEGATAAAKGALRQLVAAKQLTLANPRLVPTLHALAAFALLCPVLFAPHAERVTALVTDHVLRGGHHGSGSGTDNDSEDGGGINRKRKGAGKGKGRARIGGGQRREKEAAGPSPECERLVAALELLTNWLEEDLGTGRAGGAAAALLEEPLARAAELMDVLMAVVETQGVAPNGAALGPRDQEELRLAAACCVLRLMQNRRAAPLLTPRRWHALAWVLLDESESVRLRFLRAVCAFVADGSAPLRFMAYLCLVVDEPDAVRKNARPALAAAIRRRRVAYEARNAELVLGQQDNNGGRGMDADAAARRRDQLTMCMPEYVLPYVVHLLAHHPDFPGGEQDEVRVKHLRKCLHFVINELVASLGTEADNLAFLLQLLATIAESYRDALESADPRRLPLVAKLAREGLQRLIKTQDNLQQYPGAVFVPSQLY